MSASAENSGAASPESAAPPRRTGLASREGLSNGSRGEPLAKAASRNARLGASRGASPGRFPRARRPAALGVTIGVGVFLVVRYVLAMA